MKIEHHVFMLGGENLFSWQLLNILGMAIHRPEGLSGSTMFFKETFGTFPLLFEMIQGFLVKFPSGLPASKKPLGFVFTKEENDAAEQ